MSNKHVVVVARTGSPYFVGDDGTSANGESDTHCVVEHLADLGYQVVYFGLCNGEHRLRKDVILMKPDLSRVNENTSASELIERLDPLIAQLEAMRPICCVNVAGAPASWSWPDNPNASFTQSFAVRYSAPCLYMIHKIGLPRVCVITDPKVYQRDCEMSGMWPECRPIAVLSQEDVEFDKRIQDVKYRVHARYAGCEYWRTQGWTEKEYTKQFWITAAAHSHYGRGALGKGRDNAWPMILDDFLSKQAHQTRICGKMWEEHPTRVKYPEVFVGCLENELAVHGFLGSGECGPMIPQKRGFATTKIRLNVLNGNVPLPYGRGGPYTYDADARVVPMDSPFRIDEDGEGLGRAARYVRENRGISYDYLHSILEKTTPDWKLLDKCVYELSTEAGRDGAIAQTPAWVKMYGGYVRR